jgi:hypothetical protein
LFDKWRTKGQKGEPIFPTFLDKLRAIFYPPAWTPGVNVEPFFHWFSLVDHTVGVPDVSYLNRKFYRYV